MAGISYPSLCVGVHILDGGSYSKTRSKVLWQVLLVETQARKGGCGGRRKVARRVTAMPAVLLRQGHWSMTEFQV